MFGVYERTIDGPPSLARSICVSKGYSCSGKFASPLDDTAAHAGRRCYARHRALARGHGMRHQISWGVPKKLRLLDPWSLGSIAAASNRRILGVLEGSAVLEVS